MIVPQYHFSGEYPTGVPTVGGGEWREAIQTEAYYTPTLRWAYIAPKRKPLTLTTIPSGILFSMRKTFLPFADELRPHLGPKRDESPNRLLQQQEKKR